MWKNVFEKKYAMSFRNDLWNSHLRIYEKWHSCLNSFWLWFYPQKPETGRFLCTLDILYFHILYSVNHSLKCLSKATIPSHSTMGWNPFWAMIIFEEISRENPETYLSRSKVLRIWEDVGGFLSRSGKKLSTFDFCFPGKTEHFY